LKSIESRMTRGGLLALALVCGPALAGLLVDADSDWKEGEVTLPPAVEETRLRPFDTGTPSPNRFFVDEGSVSVGEDGVVRYTLVARAAGGAENVTFEGIRCATGERRIYASGRPDGNWVAMKKSEWQAIGGNAYNRPRAALAWDYLCDGLAAPRSRDHALQLLKQRRSHYPSEVR